jgi:hypothetical protein
MKDRAFGDNVDRHRPRAATDSGREGFNRNVFLLCFLVQFEVIVKYRLIFIAFSSVIWETSSAVPPVPQTSLSSGAAFPPATLREEVPQATQQYGPLNLSNDIIRKAIQEAPDEKSAANLLPSESVEHLGSSRNEEILTRAFQEAKVPDCLHQDAMKFAPPRIGVIGIAGEFALPWWAYAVLSGHCN